MEDTCFCGRSLSQNGFCEGCDELAMDCDCEELDEDEEDDSD